MGDEATTESTSEPHGVIGLMRKHPTLTLLSVAGIGLFGGIELAAGVLLGMGVSAFVRRSNGQSAAKSHDAFDALRARMREIVLAARGRLRRRSKMATLRITTRTARTPATRSAPTCS